MLRRLVVFAVLALAPSVYSAPRPPRAVRSQSFDWDANAVSMKTTIYLRSHTGEPEIGVPLADWHRVQKQLGKPGPYEHRYFDRDRMTGGYRDMTEVGNGNTFLRDLKVTVETKGWQGPAWPLLVDQLSTPAGARRASIITAREHSADSMYAGLKFLRSRGLIKYLPPKANLYGVNREDITVDGEPLVGETPARKLRVQKSLLDHLQKDAQRHLGQRQVWHFSDDDFANYTATKQGLAADVQTGRWRNVDIVLHFTGLHGPHAPEVVTLDRPAL
ncbi:MAG: hypothetical protein ABI321_17750 [Polyangia bacterium]